MRFAVAALLPCLAWSALRAAPLGPRESRAEDGEAAEVRDIIKHVKHVEAEILRDQRSDKDLHRRHLRKRLSDDLSGEVEQALPKEVKALQKLFMDPLAADSNTQGSGAAGHALGRHSRVRRHRRSNKHMTYKKECGMSIKASQLGLRRNAHVLLQTANAPEESTEEEEPERYSGGPGAGSVQVVADNGRSKLGTVEGEEPYVTVYKDGYFAAGCIKDGMLEKYDKYGDRKDQYHQSAQFVNQSIVLYNQVVLKEAHKPMSPTVCFEFCRTVKQMSFFGINNGRTCYCMPYYKPTAGGEGDDCSIICGGDYGATCGGQQKSSVFEMHTCGDKGAQLMEKAKAAGDALTDFYAVALHAAALSKSLQASGALLETAAGAVGDSGASDLGMAAKQFAGEVNAAVVAGKCLDTYNNLLTIYEETEQIALLNMRVAKNLQKADDASAVMATEVPKLETCVKAVEEVVEQGYPAYRKSAEADSKASMLKAEEAFALALNGYLPVTYVLENQEMPTPTTCSGKLIGKPMVGTLAECAKTCDDLVQQKCAGFQFFHLGGTAGSEGEPAKPLCFMFEEVETIAKYDCDFVKAQTESEKTRLKEEAESKESFLQGAAGDEPPKEGEEEEEEEKKIGESMCSLPLEQLMQYSAVGCDGLFGPEHSIKETCPAQCGRSNGALIGAMCVSRASEIFAFTTNAKQKVNKACFGGAGNSEVETKDEASPFLLPFDDNGVRLSGDAKVGAENILEPIIWTAESA